MMDMAKYIRSEIHTERNEIQDGSLDERQNRRRDERQDRSRLMNIVILGGGKIGFYLTKTLLPNGHRITIIEKDAEVCRKVANDLKIPVINGDGTRMEDLDAAGTGKAEVFIAVSGRDEDNLIACQLAGRKFGVKRTISRVNNPKNITVYESLGVEAVSSTSIIADLIEQEIDYQGIKTLIKMKGGKVMLSEAQVSAGSPICGKMLREAGLPRGCIFVSIIRDDKAIVPYGNTVIKDGDVAVIVSREEDKDILKSSF